MHWVLRWFTTSQTARAGARPELTGLLELRIHGVNNTSPASMLDLPTESVEPVVGDELAGFWREKDEAQDGLQEGDRGWRPKELTREAYSWGGLARNTPDVPAGGALTTLGRGLARVGWALLLPFGIANIAYWTRRLDTREAVETDLPGGWGAGGARLFGLGLTALPVVTACEVAMDLIATQCYRDAMAQCGRLPSAFTVLVGRETPMRLVIAATVPLALLLVFYLLSSVTRSYYERATSPAYADRPPGVDPRQHLLATPGFWAGEVMVGRLVRLHLSLGIAIVTLAMAWPAAFGRGHACRTPSSVLDQACRNQAFAGNSGLRWWLTGCVALATVVIVAVMITTVLRSSDAPDVSASSGRAEAEPPKDVLTRFLIGLATADLLLTAGLLAFAQPVISDDAALLGVSAAPTITLAVLAALALSGLTWRLGRWTGISAPVLAASFLAIPFVSQRRELLVFICVVLAVVLIRWFARGKQAAKRDRKYVAWSGGGPGIMMGLALMVSLTLASLVTLVAGDWLNGKNSAADLVVHEYLCVRACSSPEPHLLLPAPYVLFAGAALITVLVALVFAGAVLLRTAVGPPPPAANGSPPPDLSPRLEHSVKRARRFAGRAHRAEKFLAVLVGTNLVFVVLVLVLAASEWPGKSLGDHNVENALRKVIGLGTLAMAAAGGAVLVALVGGKATGRTRPLGLVWDLVCVLPRAAHPFGPPCYAERAVPELVGRCASWLDTTLPQGEGRTRRGNRIVLSAHSLGSVLAVAALFALPLDEKPGRPAPMRLLTYGSQLRAYFGRIFPELFGPDVLGTPPVQSAQLCSRDPWSSELDDGSKPQPSGTADSVVSRLTDSRTSAPRWRSLWRRTDYLGFPVKSYSFLANDIDYAAEEIDETGYLIEVVSHSNYPRAPAYDKAFGELVPPTEADDSAEQP